MEVLKNLAAEEANVWFLLGKCYKGLGQRAASVRAYTTALNLDPKVSEDVKSLDIMTQLTGMYRPRNISRKQWSHLTTQKMTIWMMIKTGSGLHSILESFALRDVPSGGPRSTLECKAGIEASDGSVQ